MAASRPAGWPAPASSGHSRPPRTVISLIFRVFSLIHFSLRTFSVALISSLSFLISYQQENRQMTEELWEGDMQMTPAPGQAWGLEAKLPRCPPPTVPSHPLQPSCPLTPGAALFWMASRASSTGHRPQVPGVECAAGQQGKSRPRGSPARAAPASGSPSPYASGPPAAARPARPHTSHSASSCLQSAAIRVREVKLLPEMRPSPVKGPPLPSPRGQHASKGATPEPLCPFLPGAHALCAYGQGAAGTTGPRSPTKGLAGASEARAGTAGVRPRLQAPLWPRQGLSGKGLILSSSSHRAPGRAQSVYSYDHRAVSLTATQGHSVPLGSCLSLQAPHLAFSPEQDLVEMQLNAGRAGNFHSPHLGSSGCTPAPGGRSSPPGHGWPRKAWERLRVHVLLDTSHQSVLSVTPPRVCRAHLPRHTSTMLGWEGRPWRKHPMGLTPACQVADTSSPQEKIPPVPVEGRVPSKEGHGPSSLSEA